VFFETFTAFNFKDLLIFFFSSPQNDLNSNDKNCKNLNNDSSDHDLMGSLEHHVKHLRVLLDELSGTAEYISKVYKEDIQNMHMNYNMEFNNEIKHYYTSNPSDIIN
jgi:hypothetical protein